MALRAPPRAPPFSDYDALVSDLSSRFHAMPLPDEARTHWTASEIDMWFQSGGAIAPAADPKARAQAEQMGTTREPSAGDKVAEAESAAKRAPWFSKLTKQDVQKVSLYRSACIQRGQPERTVGDCYPADDPWLTEMRSKKNYLAFEKHILFWDEDNPTSGASVALWGQEGFTHGASAALRGMDMRCSRCGHPPGWLPSTARPTCNCPCRYSLDTSSLKLVAAVRYTPAALIAWRSGAEDSAENFNLDMVHGGCIEMALDELTAEVMKINVAPQNVTAEITFKIKKPSHAGITYKAEAEITDVSIPVVRVAGKITTLEGEVSLRWPLAPCGTVSGEGTQFVGVFSLEDELQLNIPNLVRFLVKLEAGYKDVPFHNYVHAADVTHGTAYFLKEEAVNKHLTPLDTFCLIIGAAMHDFRHPGYNNAFLVNTRDEKAILYNDTSVRPLPPPPHPPVFPPYPPAARRAPAPTRPSPHGRCSSRSTSPRAGGSCSTRRRTATRSRAGRPSGTPRRAPRWSMPSWAPT